MSLEGIDLLIVLILLVSINFPSLRLWDKLPPALQRSGGKRVSEEAQKHNWVLPVHACLRLKNQGQQLESVLSLSFTKLNPLYIKWP